MEGIRIAGPGSLGRRIGSIATVAILVIAATGTVFAQAIPQKNVDVVGPAWPNWLRACNVLMQQNEPDGVRSLLFPKHMAIGFNDYRCVNDPLIGEAFPGIAMTRDGDVWWSGLHPENLAETPNIGQKGGADPNLEIVPGLMLYNFIAFWRDGSQNPGIYTSQWYEHNRDFGPPFEYLATYPAIIGNPNKFLDKPSFKKAFRDPDAGLPDIQVAIPAFSDPRNPANSHAAYTLSVPATRTHLCFSAFVGNGDGTKIECKYSDDLGATWSQRVKLSESVEINQGTSIAFRNFTDMIVVWTRFEDNNETAAVMYALSNDAGETFGPPKEIAEFCPFNQPTGVARPRSNALPVVVSSGADFAVYIASRNDATETCNIPAKGNQDETPRMSPVSLEDDFDSFGEDLDAEGNRMKDGFVRTSLNFSRIMMIRGSGNNNINWSTPVMIDPQESAPGVRKRGHQFMVACDAAGTIETCTYFDTRLDKLNLLPTPLTGGFVQDMVLHLEPDPSDPTGRAVVSAQVLPAGVYDQVPPPAELPPNTNNVPLRRSLELFAAQIENGTPRTYTVNKNSFYATDVSDPDAISSPSVRVSRFATRQKPGAPAGVRQQAVWNYSGARMFQKGLAAFIGDYNTVFTASDKKRQDGTWVPHQGPLDPAVDLFSSAEPEFQLGWTSNHKARGKIFYTGCDVWNETLQMWEAGTGCASPYTDPDSPMLMLPLQGEDGSNDPPLTCTNASALGLSRAPLTRNQTVMTAAMLPGISVEVVSAIKRPEGNRNTFVLQILNGSKSDRTVNLTVPAGELVSFDRDMPDSLLTIPVVVPKGSGNARTVFDFGNIDTDPGLAASVLVTVTDDDTGEVLAKVQLLRESLAPLENVQSNDPDNPINLTDGFEFFELLLKREIGLDPNQATLDLENLDLENTVDLLDLENLDLENLDLENKVIFLDLENFDLENLDLENSLYQQLDLENLVINLDLENLDLENRLLYFDLENFDLENLDLENFDLENFDLENLDLENLDLENLDLENESIFASDVENFDLENLDLENTAPGAGYTEISWTGDSANNTTTGVDLEPIFSASLANDLVNSGATVLLTVRRGYMQATAAIANSTTACTPQVVVDNQILYAAVLTPDKILQSVFSGSVNDPDPLEADTPGFFVAPDTSTIITLRVINPPLGLTLDELSDNSGIALFAQGGDGLSCDAELPGAEVDAACEVDFPNFDVTPPVITLTGPSTLSVDQDSMYVDPGVTAVDDIDGDLSANVVLSGWDFDTSIPGSYTIDYDVIDEAGNAADTVSRTVIVIDTEDPVVTLIGDAIVTTEAGFPFDDPGATATDNVGVVGGVTSDAGTQVDTSIIGDYIVTYTASDSEGNAGTATRTVQVRDTIVPVITLLGNDPIVLEAGIPFADPGATVSDAGDPSVMVVVDASGVNTAIVGSYSVTYDATDASGNVAIQVTRTVDVVDTSMPVLAGFPPDPVTDPDDPIVLPPGDTQITVAWPISASDPNPGLAAYCDIGTAPNIVRITPVSSQVSGGSIIFTFDYPFGAGTTNIMCTAVDQGGNEGSGSFTVSVEDVPVIDPATLPAQPIDVEANDPSGYVGPTASLWDPVAANDQIDGTIIAVCTPENDLAFGANTITCTATDSAGNVSPAETFTATVIDTTPPVASFIDDPLVITTIEASVTVTAEELKQNVTANDIVDGAITDPAQFSCTVNGGPSASLPVGIHAGAGSCTATDQAGNESAPVTFDIEIRFEYDFTMIIPNGNKQAGSVIPLDWYYTLPGTSTRIDSSSFVLTVSWFGPFLQNNCNGVNTGLGDGTEANFAGNSNFRWSAAQKLWQYSWQTPMMGGSYEVQVSPPGTQQSTECVNLR